MNEIGGGAIRVGNGTAGGMWSVADGQDALNEVDPQVSENAEHHILDVSKKALFTFRPDPPQGGRNPDMLLNKAASEMAQVCRIVAYPAEIR